MLIKPVNEVCSTCHGPNTQNGPHAPTIEAHTHHAPGSAGSECVACHMPKIEQTIADVNVRAHTFKFITPAASDALKIPNACNLCHTDKTTAWSTEALKGWQRPITLAHGRIESGWLSWFARLRRLYRTSLFL